MDAELKKKWTDALRSGKYTQGKGWMKQQTKDQTSYCCLGVLCDVSLGFQDKPNNFSWNDGECYWRPKPLEGERFGSNSSTFTPDQLAKLGLTPEEQKTLWEMNDDQGKTFAEIADWIEAKL